MGNYQYKNSDPIDFPEIFDFSKYPPNQNQPVNYFLQGAITHIGDIRHGHYISYIFDQQKNQWVEFDDSIPTPVNIQTLFQNNIGRHKVKNQLSTAYVLFYRREFKYQIDHLQCSPNLIKKVKQYFPTISVKSSVIHQSIFSQLNESIKKKKAIKSIPAFGFPVFIESSLDFRSDSFFFDSLIFEQSLAIDSSDKVLKNILHSDISAEEIENYVDRFKEDSSLSSKILRQYDLIFECLNSDKEKIRNNSFFVLSAAVKELDESFINSDFESLLSEMSSKFLIHKPQQLSSSDIPRYKYHYNLLFDIIIRFKGRYPACPFIFLSTFVDLI
jgi:hypothetical protein